VEGLKMNTKSKVLHIALCLMLVTSLLGLLIVPAVAQSSNLLSNIPVVGTLADGGTFVGTLTITDIAIQNGQLVADGVLTGTATQAGIVTQITQNFTNIVLDLLNGGGASCDILNLDLGPLFLDLLGLQVDLSAISLDITAVRGAGNLLGNLLCAVAGLLDSGGPLSAIQQLLNQINNLL
jgi:hypothetical protein